MKILIDINHPAHVHYSKHLIRMLLQRGHRVLVTSRERDPSFKLLESEGIPYINRGTGSNKMMGKALYFFQGDYAIFKAARKFAPDIFLCFMSPYAPQVARLMGKPCIVVDDTEHAKLHDHFTYPFCDAILTPSCFYRDLGEKQVRFDSYLELNYLHPNYFKPDIGIYNLLGIQPAQPYVLLRLVAWGGHHDRGQSGLSEETQKETVRLLSQKFKVFISSEKELPAYFEQYRIPVPPEKIHDVLAFASLFVGESGTMAGECAVLGTPSIYVNSLPLMGYLRAAQENGILFYFKGDNGVLVKIKELMQFTDLRKQFQPNHEAHIKNKIDGTSFLLWFLENYPDSIRVMKGSLEFQEVFQ